MGAAGSLATTSAVYSAQSNEKVQIEKLLGAGGQGEVYKVAYRGQSYALKWFHQNIGVSADQRRCVENLVRQGKPSANFLWPMEIVLAQGSSSFGYLMELRESRFENFDSVVTAKVDPLFSILMRVGLNLVESFHSLHAKGLCYRDINFGNGFFDPMNGEVLICDNDNVAENNTSLNTVLGTPDFMAPEVVNGTALPSRNTDYFSLAVLLFYLYHIQHPLVGSRVLSIRSWDLPARELLFGKEPVFIFDPTNKSNAAIDDKNRDPLGEAGKNAIPYWNDIYPQVLKDAFTLSFTEGIRDPSKRLSGSRWTDVLTKCDESIFRCSRCDKEVFYDLAVGPRPCWNCKSIESPSFRLEFSNKQIVLSKTTKLYRYQLDGASFDMYSPVVAEVVAHPTRQNVFGLCNKTSAPWSATPANSPSVEIPPSKSIPLCDGTEVRMGRCLAKIVAIK